MHRTLTALHHFPQSRNTALRRKITNAFSVQSMPLTVSSVRSESIERKISKFIEKDIKKRQLKNSRGIEKDIQPLLEKYIRRGEYTISEEVCSIRMVLSKTTEKFKVKIDFDAWDRTPEHPHIFDCCLENISTSEGQEGNLLVVTCVSGPQFQPLTIRFVPPGISLLDKNIYDILVYNPDEELLISDKLLNGMKKFLASQGIDRKLSIFVEHYAFWKSQREEINTLAAISTFVSKRST